MANYQYVIDSTYQPLSMQEMLTPLLMYKEAFEQSEAAYGELTKEADKFKYLSETLPEGSKARQIYEGYAKGLAAQAKDLARNGLSMNNRRALSEYKRRFTGEIGQLSDAQAKMEKELELRRAQDLKDPSMIYNTSSFTIDDFLGGKSPNLYGVSGNLLYTKGAALGKSLSSRITSTGDAGSTLGGYYRMLREAKGVPQVAIDEFMNSKMLKDQVDAMMKADGIYDNLSGKEFERAKQNILRGIYDGIVYEEKNQVQRDLSKMSAAEIDSSKKAWASLQLQEREYLLNKQKYEDERAAKYQIDPATGKVVGLKSTGAAGEGGINGIAPNPVNIYTPVEKQKISDNIAKYSQYFSMDPRDGRLKLNKKGLAEYNRKVGNTNAGTAGAVVATTGNSPFRNFIDSLGGSKYMGRNVQPGNVGNLWKQYLADNNPGNYDAKKRTEFNYKLHESQYDVAKSAVQAAMRGLSNLEEVELDDKSNKFQKVGKLSMKDFADKDYKVIETNFSVYGNTMLVRNPKGEVKRYKLPSGINPYNEANRDRALAGALQVQQALVDGYFVVDGKRVPLTQQQKEALQARYAQLIQDANMYHSQLWLTNKTKEQEFGPYSY